MPRQTGFNQTLCADSDGFSLHAAVRCSAEDRQALEQLCRCITRLSPGQRARAMQRRGPGGAEAENADSAETHLYSSYVVTKTPVARRHHAPGDAAAAVHAAACGTGDRRAPFGRPRPRPRLHLIRFHGRAGSQRQVARAGGAARAGRGRSRQRSRLPVRRTVRIPARCG